SCFSCYSSAPPASASLSLHDALPILAHRRPLVVGLAVEHHPVVHVVVVAGGEQPRQGGADEHQQDAAGSAGVGHEQARQQKEQRSEEHTSELQSRFDLVCRLLLEKKK